MPLLTGISVPSSRWKMPLFEMTAALAVAIGALEIVGRRRAPRWSAHEYDDQGDDPHSATVLDIGMLAQGIHVEVAELP
jgi:hypothetical protein